MLFDLFRIQTPSWYLPFWVSKSSTGTCYSDRSRVKLKLGHPQSNDLTSRGDRMRRETESLQVAIPATM
jgi:hypothetical protein